MLQYKFKIVHVSTWTTITDMSKNSANFNGKITYLYCILFNLKHTKLTITQKASLIQGNNFQEATSRYCLREINVSLVIVFPTSFSETALFINCTSRNIHVKSINKA